MKVIAAFLALCVALSTALSFGQYGFGGGLLGGGLLGGGIGGGIGFGGGFSKFGMFDTIYIQIIPFTVPYSVISIFLTVP